jgi:hypothetical protein
MAWLLAFMVLLLLGALLRRLMGLTAAGRDAGTPLSGEGQQLCQDTTLEIQARSAMMAISLDDAMEERDSEHFDNARNLLYLTASGWERLAGLLTFLLQVTADYLPLARTAVPARAMDAAHFKSESMIEYVRLHEWVDQFLFRNKLRFNLQVRILRRAVETLTEDFREAQPRAHSAVEDSSATWNRLDHDLHDLDLISKEILLTIRSFLVCLPESAIRQFAAELRPVLERGVRSGAWSHAGRVPDN